MSDITEDPERSTGCSSKRTARRSNGELVLPLLDLVDRRLIRILDVLVLVKREEGDVDVLTTDALSIPTKVGDLGALAGASSGLLSAVTTSPPGRIARHPGQPRPSLCGVREPVVAAVRGGLVRKLQVAKLVAQGHIPTQAILAALDALEA